MYSRFTPLHDRYHHSASGEPGWLMPTSGVLNRPQAPAWKCTIHANFNYIALSKIAATGRVVCTYYDVPKIMCGSICSCSAENFKWSQEAFKSPPPLRIEKEMSETERTVMVTLTPWNQIKPMCVCVRGGGGDLTNLGCLHVIQVKENENEIF